MKGYSDRSNCYKALNRYCDRIDIQTSFYKVIRKNGRFHFVER